MRNCSGDSSFEVGSTGVGGRFYAYTSGPKVAGQNTTGGMVSATGTTSGVYNAYYSYDGMNHLRDQGGAANPTDTNAGEPARVPRRPHVMLPTGLWAA